MKKLLAWFIAGLLLAPAALFAAAAFEGRVNFKMTSGGKSQDMRYAIKGDKIRVEMPGQHGMGGMILDTVKGETIMLMDEQRMYMVMPVPNISEMAGQQKDGEVPTLEKTGETEKILGYTAEKYVSTHQGMKTELWLAEGIGTFAAFNQNPMGGRSGGMQMPRGWEKALAGKPLFPLRVVGFDRSGKESFKMEVTNIDRQALPDGMFSPPADYQRMDMGGMMRGMIPGMPKR